MTGPMLMRADAVTEGLHPSEKAVLTRLCIDADQRGAEVSMLSASQLAVLTGFSLKAVILARTRLADLGLILMCGDNGKTPETVVDPKPLAPPKIRTGLAKCKLGVAKRKRIMERDAYRCRQCGDHRNLSIDHIIPRAAGGSNDDSNLQTLCVPCNNKKGAQLP